MEWFTLSSIALAAALGLETASAQEAPAPDPAPTDAAAPAGPDWRVVSRATDRANLIDVNSLAPGADGVTLKAARVRTTSRAGDYSHTVNLFAVRCQANELHLVEESDIAADGTTADTYPADEPWLPVEPGSFDEGIKMIACEEGSLAGPGYPSIRAFIDAGRP
ncbi:hypothetical protein BZG35_03070 [Brevundimonas sp. LM2]|uniref:hypothetical protein n=1 Tax=Brevundimonas sp. LM2 TaxID=1938605 RepID=UPI000983C937|nr:hypothetical protein [Brevundimonas sp. LM2]AQR60746.1 hypothetical protein BZG35_03070 [Brevundimonas sp. LM2]